MAVTFSPSAKKPEVVPKDSRCIGHPVTSSKNFRELCGSVLQGSSYAPTPLDPESFTVAQENGFVHAVVDAYCQHHNLVIRPDDVWLAIMSQFAFMVNGNSESLRSKFVQHEGKKELVVRIPGSLHSADYRSFATLMAGQLREHLRGTAEDPEVAEWILPNFSTTTPNDTIAGSIMLMGAMKSYFAYTCCLLCGIPSITLEGTPEDWHSICARVSKLSLYGCESWLEMLEPITREFAAASAGKVDTTFWQRICHYHPQGSGPTHLSGWITAFCVFTEDGKWQGDSKVVHTTSGTLSNPQGKLEFPVVSTDDVPAGYVSVDVKIEDESQEYQAMMFAGHMGYSVIDNTTLAPRPTWAICLRKAVTGSEGRMQMTM